MPARIFISHSSNDDAQAAEVRDAVYAALAAVGCEPLLDRAFLSAGDRWRPKLFAMMAACDGAVLLLSELALASDWVRTEGIILAWRSALDPSVKVVPVLLGQTTADVRNAGFRPVALDELQMLRSQEESPADLALRIAEVFKDHTRGSTAKDPFALWVKSVSVLLRENGLLDEAADALDIGILDRGAPEELPVLVAAALLHADAGPIEGALALLAQGLTLEQRVRLALLVSPSLLPAETVRGLLGIANREGGSSRVAALRSAQSPTAKRLVNRATCCFPMVKIVEPPDDDGFGELDEQELLERYRRNIAYAYGADTPHQVSTEVVREFEAAGWRMFVVLEAPALRRGILASLVADFAEAVFVCAGGEDDLTAACAALGVGVAASVEPPLDPDLEVRQWIVANRLERIGQR